MWSGAAFGDERKLHLNWAPFVKALPKLITQDKCVRLKKMVLTQCHSRAQSGRHGDALAGITTVNMKFFPELPLHGAWTTPWASCVWQSAVVQHHRTMWRRAEPDTLTNVKYGCGMFSVWNPQPILQMWKQSPALNNHPETSFWSLRLAILAILGDYEMQPTVDGGQRGLTY